MPDAVPEFLQDTFRSLIPLVVNAIIWTVLGYGCVALTQTALPVLITGLLGMPLAALTSVPGIIIIVIIASLLWTMGVHGTVAVYAAIAAPLMQYYATNYANHEPVRRLYLCQSHYSVLSIAVAEPAIHWRSA